MSDLQTGPTGGGEEQQVAPTTPNALQDHALRLAAELAEYAREHLLTDRHPEHTLTLLGRKVLDLARLATDPQMTAARARKPAPKPSPARTAPTPEQEERQHPDFYAGLPPIEYVARALKNPYNSTIIEYQVSGVLKVGDVMVTLDEQQRYCLGVLMFSGGRISNEQARSYGFVAPSSNGNSAPSYFGRTAQGLEASLRTLFGVDRNNPLTTVTKRLRYTTVYGLYTGLRFSQVGAETSPENAVTNSAISERNGFVRTLAEQAAGQRTLPEIADWLRQEFPDQNIELTELRDIIAADGIIAPQAGPGGDLFSQFAARRIRAALAVKYSQE